MPRSSSKGYYLYNKNSFLPLRDLGDSQPYLSSAAWTDPDDGDPARKPVNVSDDVSSLGNEHERSLFVRFAKRWSPFFAQFGAIFFPLVEAHFGWVSFLLLLLVGVHLGTVLWSSSVTFRRWVALVVKAIIFGSRPFFVPVGNMIGVILTACAVSSTSLCATTSGKNKSSSFSLSGNGYPLRFLRFPFPKSRGNSAKIF